MKKLAKVDLFFTVVWVLILISGICFKFSAKLIGWPDFSDSAFVENRALEPKPNYQALPAKEWGRATERWYNDNFAWRYEIISCYKYLHFNWLKSPARNSVPGKDGWIFGRIDPADRAQPGAEEDFAGLYKWPEVEDYMGIIRMDKQTIADWVTLFEGRVAWAEAHGSRFLQVFTPMKIHVHSEKILPMIASHRRESFREDLREALKESPVCTNVFFMLESLQHEVALGHEVYYKEDKHENAYGCYCIYRDLLGRMRDLWFPDLPDFPFYNSPVPADVLEGRAPGCWENEDRRLVISNPGTKVEDWRPLRISAKNVVYRRNPIFVRQPGTNRYVIICHDSFLRYPFASWHDQNAQFALPLGRGFDRVASMIFTRLNTEKMERYFTDVIPDVLIEQFSEGRLQLGVYGLDDTMRRAAAWGRGKNVDNPESQTNLMAMALIENVVSDMPKSIIKINLVDNNGKIIASSGVLPGVRRAVFFGTIPNANNLKVALVGGKAESISLKFRNPGP